MRMSENSKAKLDEAIKSWNAMQKLIFLEALSELIEPRLSAFAAYLEQGFDKQTVEICQDMQTFNGSLPVNFNSVDELIELLSDMATMIVDAELYDKIFPLFVDFQYYISDAADSTDLDIIMSGYLKVYSFTGAVAAAITKWLSDQMFDSLDQLDDDAAENLIYYISKQVIYDNQHLGLLERWNLD